MDIVDVVQRHFSHISVQLANSRLDCYSSPRNQLSRDMYNSQVSKKNKKKKTK